MPNPTMWDGFNTFGQNMSNCMTATGEVSETNPYCSSGNGLTVANALGTVAAYTPILVFVVGASIGFILIRKMLKKAYSPAKRV